MGIPVGRVGCRAGATRRGQQSRAPQDSADTGCRPGHASAPQRAATAVSPWRLADLGTTPEQGVCIRTSRRTSLRRNPSATLAHAATPEPKILDAGVGSAIGKNRKKISTAFQKSKRTPKHGPARNNSSGISHAEPCSIHATYTEHCATPYLMWLAGNSKAQRSRTDDAGSKYV